MNKSVLVLLISYLGTSTGCCRPPPTTTPAPPTTASVWKGTCSLAAIDSRYSKVTYSEVSFMFEQDGSCLVKRPPRWNEWVNHHFGAAGRNVSFYADSDNDGLVNVLEYYADEIGNGDRGLTRDTLERNSIHRMPPPLPIGQLGLDPNDADSDGDLLTDGFEWFYGFNPKVQDDILADPDSDSLDNIREQIVETDPLNNDSDGDGVSDGTEVDQGSDPHDSEDDAQPPETKVAQIQLTVGDQSGSHSERWILNVGSFHYQNDVHGTVASQTFEIPVGVYQITLDWRDSIYDVPDHDYTALVSKVGGEADVTIEDPQGLLKIHNPGTWTDPNTAVGKTATLTVGVSCEEGSTDPECVCGELSDCTTCMDDNQCIWKQGLCRAAPSDITEEDRNRVKLKCLVGDCEFYNEVERIISCGSTSYPYAIQYGFKYCNRFAQFISDFTADGQAWVNGVRPCLHEAIIDTVVDPATTCKILKDNAFDSHPLCYVRTNPSFCNVALDSSNWDGLWNVFDFGDLLKDESIQQIEDTCELCGEWYDWSTFGWLGACSLGTGIFG